MSKIYIAGPMSGLPGFNRPAFHRAAAHIVRRGNVALNPAILPDGLEQAEYMDICLAMETNVVINTFVKETGGSVASQLEACTRCGMCAEACHFYQATGNPEYAPVWKIELLKRAYEQRFTLIGKMKLALGIDKRITDEEISHFSQIVYEACTMLRLTLAVKHCSFCARPLPMCASDFTKMHSKRSTLPTRKSTTFPFSAAKSAAAQFTSMECSSFSS